MFSEKKCLFNDGKESTLFACSVSLELADGLFAHCHTLPLLYKPKLNKLSAKGLPCCAKRDYNLFSNIKGSYTISSTVITAEPLTKVLADLVDQVNAQYDENYNAVVVNYYQNGCNTIGRHHDGVDQLGRHGVVTISVGATRTFLISSDSPEFTMPIPFTHGLCLQMKGEFQKHYCHEILCEPNIIRPRYSLTFRTLREINH